MAVFSFRILGGLQGLVRIVGSVRTSQDQVYEGAELISIGLNMYLGE